MTSVSSVFIKYNTNIRIYANDTNKIQYCFPFVLFVGFIRRLALCNMNFQVPQFIEMEDKIFGPLTFKQFLYMAGGIGLAFIFYAFLPLYLALVPMLAVVLLASALSFFKVNNRPFVFTFESAIAYALKSKLYLWQKKLGAAAARPVTAPKTSAEGLPRLSESRLSDIAWNLDVKSKLE